MENRKSSSTSSTRTTCGRRSEPTQTQPEIKKDEVKDEVKQLTQKQIDEIIEKRLTRQKESFQKEQEALLAQKEQEWQAKA